MEKLLEDLANSIHLRKCFLQIYRDQKFTWKIVPLFINIQIHVELLSCALNKAEKQKDNDDYKSDKCIKTSASYVFLEHFSGFVAAC